ncbi:hypothetical protein AA0118_g1040 [Alternaria tenuissima]|nr:hypothetical protein AA0118_g1040 [Alternaria tenuissima]RYO02052.1 hypothetical protein AA0120_g263 [Alternaria tenuissima]
MTTHTDTGPMDIDFDKLPTAIDTIQCPESPEKSDSGDSDKSTLSYTDDFETLPSSGPTSHAHIIDLEEYATSMKEEETLKLQDAIVTTLFNVSLATLRSFVNPTVNAFKAVFGTKDVPFVIWRKGLEVLIGTFEHHKSMKLYRFEHVAGFLIGYDGSWHLKVTASNAYSAPKWPDVWAGKFECHDGVAKITIENEEMNMAKRASILVSTVISGRYWELKTDIKMI